MDDFRFIWQDNSARQRERARSLSEFREYIDHNNPPILSDLRERMRPLLAWRYATLPDLLIIVNAKIAPMKLVNTYEGVHTHGTDFLDGLKMVDTQQSQRLGAVQNFHGPVGTVGENNASSIAQSTKERQTPPQGLLHNPLFLTLLGVPIGLVVAYITYKLHWQGH